MIAAAEERCAECGHAVSPSGGALICTYRHCGEFGRDQAEGEQAAVREDARRRLVELRRVRSLLWPDRDDPEVLSELVVIEGQIKQCEDALR